MSRDRSSTIVADDALDAVVEPMNDSTIMTADPSDSSAASEASTTTRYTKSGLKDKIKELEDKIKELKDMADEAPEGDVSEPVADSVVENAVDEESGGRRRRRRKTRRSKKHAKKSRKARY